MFPRVKICCISSVDEAAMAVSCGASALGLVSAMPSGPGVIEESQIADIIRCVPPAVSTFLLTAHQQADAIIDQHHRCRPTTLQLVDHVAEAELAKLRRTLPGISIVQVIHVSGAASVEDAMAVAPFVDGILLDSGNQKLAVKELGGTGRTHDWTLSREIRERCGRPVFLAGGLHAGNVADAFAQVNPYGVDICSGVRSDGKLDREKLRAFMRAARDALHA
jgi:phosphoribosylanthranilate isomerase